MKILWLSYVAILLTTRAVLERLCSESETRTDDRWVCHIMRLEFILHGMMMNSRVSVIITLSELHWKSLADPKRRLFCCLNSAAFTTTNILRVCGIKAAEFHQASSVFASEQVKRYSNNNYYTPGENFSEFQWKERRNHEVNEEHFRYSGHHGHARFFG